MLIPISRDISWTPPEGYFLGTVITAGPYEPRGGTSKLRIVIVPEVKNGDDIEYRVQKIYQPSIHTGSDLKRDLEILLGPDALQGRDEMDLDEVLGKTAVIHVVHIQNDNYEKPYVTFDRIYPPSMSIGEVCQSLEPQDGEGREHPVEKQRPFYHCGGRTTTTEFCHRPIRSAQRRKPKQVQENKDETLGHSKTLEELQAEINELAANDPTERSFPSILSLGL